MMIALTATGGRPWQFAQCRRMMKAQTGIDVLHVWSTDESLSVAANLLRTIAIAEQHPDVLKAARAEPSDDVLTYAVIEDDDYYPPDYCYWLSLDLCRAQLVGSAQSRYYHVPSRRWMVYQHPDRSSMCATGFQHSALPFVRSVLEANLQEPYVDLKLWQAAQARHSGVSCYVNPLATMTGIKGLPGRAGASSGHKPDHYRLVDEDGCVLRAWVGDAMAEAYEEFVCSEPGG